MNTQAEKLAHYAQNLMQALDAGDWNNIAGAKRVMRLALTEYRSAREADARRDYQNAVNNMEALGLEIEDCGSAPAQQPQPSAQQYDDRAQYGREHG